jgi:hypothetical protein
LGKIQPHAVRIMAFFPPRPRDAGKFTAFEYLIFVQTDGSQAAQKRALSALRSAHDDPEALRKLGSRIKPSFYAVVWGCYVELPDGAAVPWEHPMVINYLTLEEHRVEALKAHGKARFPVSLDYLD